MSVEEPALIKELQLAIDQDAEAFNQQMIIKQGLIRRNIYQFPEAPPLERQNHYIFNPIRDSEYKPTVSGYVRLASVLQAWMDLTPTLTVEEIVDGIMQIRDFFDREHISWMHPSIRDMSIIHMLRSKAPESQNLNMAIRRIILSGPESERTMLVRSFHDPHMARSIAYALLNIEADTFSSPMFRKDCEIALACAFLDLGEVLYHQACEFGPMPYSLEKLQALSFCVRTAATLMVRIPLIRHHNLYPLTLDDLQRYMNWGDDIRITNKCAYIIGLVC
jgi:hypothetical protein